MRRVRYYEYGGPEVLTVEEAELPTPGPGQVRLRAEAIGANFVDTKMRAGAGGIFHWPLPGSPTGDVVGTVDAVGPDVDDAQLGHRVATLAQEAFADAALADAGWLSPVPDGLDLAAASLLSTAGPMALRILRTGQLAPGETVLVHSAAGGIGGLAVQLAKLLGAGLVIATASTKEKLEYAQDLGADVGVDYSASDWPDQVRAAAPAGVDVVLDAVGGATLTSSLDLLAPFGRVVVYGAASGELVSLPVVDIFALKAVLGFSLFAWRAAGPSRAREEVAEVARYFAAGQVRAVRHTSLPLTEAAEAHRLLEDRTTLGRVLLLP